MDSLRPLTEWITANTSRREFARQVGCSESHLADVLNGKKSASLALAVKMSRACCGAVPVEAFDAPAKEVAE
jgi:transcriptional regulator with XRE-family HTH domain